MIVIIIDFSLFNYFKNLAASVAAVAANSLYLRYYYLVLIEFINPKSYFVGAELV